MGTETWEVWYPKAAATGLLHSRGRLEVTHTLLVHAVPDVLTAAVHDEGGNRVAFGQDLVRTQASPICRLTRHNGAVRREDIWPTDNDLGTPVLLPGGEVGMLKAWWNAADHKEWRWQVELYNSIR